LTDVNAETATKINISIIDSYLFKFLDLTPTVKLLPESTVFLIEILSRGHIFSRVGSFYEQAVSDLDKSMHRSLWV
jgi:hypothetical protein